jgi:hypothetical protein
MADPDVDVNAAAAMFIGTVISDVMSRPIVPHLYPPLDVAADAYARLFLRAIGGSTMIGTTEQTPAIETEPSRDTVGPSSSTSHTPQSTRS